MNVAIMSSCPNAGSNSYGTSETLMAVVRNHGLS